MDKIKEHILRYVSSDIVSHYIMERIPHIFQNKWEDYIFWRGLLGQILAIDPCSISIIGSAAVGCSLSPHKRFAEFHNKSDIDVAIVSSYYFDIGWRAIRSIHAADTRSKKELNALNEHKRNYIYSGCIAVDRVSRFLPYNREFTIASSEMMTIPPTEDREIKFRIYRDFESLRLYQLKSVDTLKAAILEDQ